MSLVVALDGPAGAGKSTIAKSISKKLGAIYVDTGAMYRAMALYMLRNGVDKDDEAAVSKAAERVDISITFEDGAQVVILNGENVNGFIRTEEVGLTASKVSTYSAVRTKLVELQRKLAETKDVVMDGRDIGTVVLPGANPKIYLTASSRVRAKRRYDELVLKGEKCDIDQIEKDIIARDTQDMNREISPLRKADDAIEVDSSDMTVEEVENCIIELCNKARNN